MEDEAICTLCDKPLQNNVDNIVQVRSNGLETFINKSESRKDEKFKLWVRKENVSFHETCRKRYSALPLKVSKREIPQYPHYRLRQHQMFLIFILVHIVLFAIKY